MSQHKTRETREATIEDLFLNKRIRQAAWLGAVIALTFLLGLGSGYWKWGRDETAEQKQQKELADLYEQVNPADGYTLPVSYRDLGPRLIEAGVIDYDAFIGALAAGGGAISNHQIDVLKKGTDEPIVITRENAHFLLNLFWAVGLADRNPILTEGPMMQYSGGQIDQFASTGGWTLGTRPIADLYASLDLIPLTAEQQARVEQVAAGIYRPCCNNHTLFPDCNHGMAMLGLLEWMAARGVSAEDMFKAAKYVNAYWFPQQALETAIYLKANQNIQFKDADARLVVSREFSSGAGAAMVHQSLQENNLLKETPGQGGSCGS